MRGHRLAGAVPAQVERIIRGPTVRLELRQKAALGCPLGHNCGG